MATIGNKALGITLLGMNERDRNRLTLFFEHFFSGSCILVGEKFADLSILDLDSLEGKKILQQQQESHPDRPLIALSVRDPDINDVTLLSKPLSTDILKNTIDKHIKALSEQASTEAAHDPAPENKPPPVSKSRIRTSNPAPATKINDRRSALPNSATQARIIHGSCSVVESKDFYSLPKDGSLYYDPGTLFQQALKSHIELSRRDNRPTRLSLTNDKYIVLLPEANVALTNLSDSKLRPRCLLPITQHQILVDYPNEAEIRHLHDDMEVPQDIDYLLWKVTLWSARGRLPLGTHIDSVIELKQWPNLTRLLAIPQFLRIAALWAKTPLPLSKTVDALNIEARYVRAFFSACFALELTQALPANEGHEVLQNNPINAGAPKGLLQRILRRLRVE
jgi:hypothetical protein